MQNKKGKTSVFHDEKTRKTVDAHLAIVGL
jgi:hypothetical protein